MKRKRSTFRKEKIIMLASSVFVLTALTVTGFYVKEKNAAEQDGYVVDMSALENNGEEKLNEVARAETEVVIESDLDYDPYFQEASSEDVTNPWNESANREIAKENPDGNREVALAQDTVAEAVTEASAEVVSAETDAEMSTETASTEATSTEAALTEAEAEEASAGAVVKREAEPALSFQERDNLAWPVAGNVLINYSMDKTVYFPTLQQYKYSPAIVIAASEGENITASADGKVAAVYDDAQLGRCVCIDIGNGFELTYGQLKDIMVLQGDVVNEGDVIGKVAAPTKYYSVEGPNVYFKMTKDDRPVNPLGNLE